MSNSVVGYKRSRSGAPYVRRAAPVQMKRRRTPLYRSLAGLPPAYIPARVFHKFYWNMSTGLWETNQSTGASVGATGYNAISFCTTLDTSTVYLGGGGTNNNQTIPNFAECQALFDAAIIDKIEYEFWFANQPHLSGSTSIDSPELIIVEDFDSVDAATSLNELLQYQKYHRISPNTTGRKYKITLYPKVRYALGAEGGEAGTATTLAGSQKAPWQDAQKPGAFHMGLRGWFITNSSSSAALGYLHCVETQYRRYKNTK